MEWDLGPQGVGLLLVMSLGFGVLTQLIFLGRATRWLWLLASGGFFVIGLLISEVMFGWATEDDLQPNIDGLSFDEVVLGFVVCVAVVLVARYLTRTRSHPPLAH